MGLRRLQSMLKQLLPSIRATLVLAVLTGLIFPLAITGIAQAVTHGDYDVHPGIDRQDEVGILGRSFAKMITSLRDKAELEELYEQMAAKAEERGAARASEPARSSANPRSKTCAAGRARRKATTRSRFRFARLSSSSVPGRKRRSTVSRFAWSVAATYAGGQRASQASGLRAAME